MAPLDFGLGLGGAGLFPESDAVGDGFNATPESRILRDLGFQAEKSVVNATTYEQQGVGYVEKISLVFTAPSVNALLFAIELNCDIRATPAAVANANCIMVSPWGTSTSIDSAITTFANKTVRMAIPATYIPTSPATISIQIQHSAGGGNKCQIKNTSLKIYYFDGISIVENSYYFA